MGGWFSKVGTDSFYASLDKQLQHLQEDTQRLQVTASIISVRPAVL